MKANVYKLLRPVLCLVLALCLTVGLCPAAFAAERSDKELGTVTDLSGMTQEQLNGLLQNGAYTPETLPLTPEDYEQGQARPLQATIDYSKYLSIEDAAKAALAYLDAWESKFTVYFQTTEADLEALGKKILDMAMTHNGQEKLGDYLRFHVAYTDIHMDGFETGGIKYVNCTFTVTYRTSQAQEQELERKFNQVMASLNLSGKTDYEKVKAIYDYITSHVTYDHAHKNDESYHLQFSAYAALVQGTAVCQGYANLFYRMALAAGLDCRIVTGWGQNEAHGWNIVKVDGKYYHVDPTWDAGKTDYEYFLKGTNDFKNHTVDFEEHGKNFFSDYPISEANYDVSQAPTVVDSGTCGKNASWKLTNDGTLTISGTGDMQYYSNPVDIPWNAYRKTIKKIVIDEGITGICDYAFNSCTALESISIPAGVTRIGKGAFSGCFKLTGVAIPNSVTLMGQAAFSDCAGLNEVTLSNGLTKIYESTFAGCVELRSIDIPHGITEINEFAFYNCSSLESAVIPDSVVSIGGSAFSGCKELVNLDIPDSVTSIGASAFRGCRKLETVKIPESVHVIEANLFASCDGLSDVELPRSLRRISDSAFENCGSLKKIVIPENVTEICMYAFNGCTSLSEIVFLGDAPEFAWSIFLGGITATAYYPTNNATWTADIMQDYGGDITWVPLGSAEAHTHTPVTAPSRMDATCTTDGKLLTLTLCETCGEELGRELTVIPALGHDFVNGICTRCGETDPDPAPESTTPPTDAPACGHQPDTVTTRVEPTCTTDGMTETVTRCTECGQELSREVTAIPALGHDFQNDECTRCGQPDHEHIPGEPEKVTLTEPTCTGDGRYVEVTRCTVCDQELSRSETPISIPELGHTEGEPKEENRVEPTCVNPGSVDSVRYCTTCGDELERQTIELPKLGHTRGEAKEENRVEATCATPGSYDLVTRCTVCDVVLDQITEKIPTPDHSWDEGKVTIEPTQVPNGEKTYTCTVCGETRVEKLEHVHSYTDNTVYPTCEKPGYTEHTCACGRRYEDDHIKALGHDYQEGTCTVCGGKDLSYRPPVKETDRVAGGNRFDTAFLTADRMKENLGIQKFDTVIVASGTNFADALSGSYLATTVNAPILLASGVDRIDRQVKAYIRENLNPGGQIYILGGEAAVPSTMLEGLEEFSIRRLAGSSRFDTNLLILREAGVDDQPILVCTGTTFADSLSASAAKLPILLVWEELTEDQKAFLNDLSGNKVYILGGEGAVSAGLQKQLSRYAPVTRLGGRDRFETSAMIAREFFQEPETAVLAYAWNFPDGLCGGPLAATMDAPLLLTMAGYEKQAAAYAKVNGIKTGIVLGGDGLIPDATVNNILG